MSRGGRNRPLFLDGQPNDVAHGTHGPAQCPVCRIGSTLLVETNVNRGPSGAPLRLVSVWSVHPRQAFRPGFARPSDSRPSWESLFLSLPAACMAQVLGGWASGGYEPSDWQPRRHARALYSPVPTLATLLVLEENLFGLMGSLAFEQRARPLALLLDHLTGA